MLGRMGAARVLSLGRVLVNLSSCVLLDRFEGAESVASLEAAAHQLMRENSLLASEYPVTNRAWGRGRRRPLSLTWLTWLRKKSVLSR